MLSVRKEVPHRVPVTIYGVLEWQSRQDYEEDDLVFFNNLAIKARSYPSDKYLFLGYLSIESVEIDWDEHIREEEEAR